MAEMPEQPDAAGGSGAGLADAILEDQNSVLSMARSMIRTLRDNQAHQIPVDERLLTAYSGVIAGLMGSSVPRQQAVGAKLLAVALEYNRRLYGDAVKMAKDEKGLPHLVVQHVGQLDALMQDPNLRPIALKAAEQMYESMVPDDNSNPDDPLNPDSRLN